MIDLERIARLEAQVEGIKEDVAGVKHDIKELHSRITTGNREIMDKIEHTVSALAESDREQHEQLAEKLGKIADRVETLENWRWMIVGGAIVVGFLLGHTETIIKLFE